jgi:hypothetical protein
LSDLTPFNPLDRGNLAASVGEALLCKKAYRLSELKPFFGAGIYAIYYSGNFEHYKPLAKRNTKENLTSPIYVGKAVPEGARKGGSTGTQTKTRALFNRLREHAESIEAASNLKPTDFYCKFLVVDDIWIPLGESLLIAKFSPIWNNLIDGFGNHDPGKGRYQGMRPRWDVLHPGRSWAEKCRERVENKAQIIADIEEFFRSTPPPQNLHFYAEQTKPDYKE